MAVAFYAELRGQPLASRAGSEPYIIQGSVSYESAVGERPIARCQVRVPAGATNPDPKDFNEKYAEGLVDVEADSR